MTVGRVVDFVETYRRLHPSADKTAITTATAAHFGLVRHRSVYVGQQIAVRFSTASGQGFSNTVLSLSALKPIDHIPFVVCVARLDGIEFFLANSTFLRKISHSSHALRVDNLRGSFNGSDILRTYEGTPNTPRNFDLLFTIHAEFTWEENLERLVEATNAIAGSGRRFVPTREGCTNILSSPGLAQEVSGTAEYRELKEFLDAGVQQESQEILRLAAIDNVNLRGNQIEQLITGGKNAHAVADLRHHLPSGMEIQIEIKTKLLGRLSAPKAYNIDKMLEALSAGHTTIVFCFVGIDPRAMNVVTRTVSIFDRSLIEATRIQFHWAGRNSRGVTQLTNAIARVFDDKFEELVDVDMAQRFLVKLLEL